MDAISRLILFGIFNWTEINEIDIIFSYFKIFDFDLNKFRGREILEEKNVDFGFVGYQRKYAVKSNGILEENFF